MKYYYVYVLQSLTRKSLYIGYSKDINKRLIEHNEGKSKATKPFRPYKLIYFEAFIKKSDAKSREIYLKSGWGRRTLNKLLKYYFND